MSRTPSWTVKPSSYVTCSCGRVCKGRAGLANHGRKCSIERARSAAFIAAIEARVHATYTESNS